MTTDGFKKYVTGRIESSKTEEVGCPECGNYAVSKWGRVMMRTGLNQNYHCNSCGHIFRRVIT